MRLIFKLIILIFVSTRATKNRKPNRLRMQEERKTRRKNKVGWATSTMSISTVATTLITVAALFYTNLTFQLQQEQHEIQDTNRRLTHATRISWWQGGDEEGNISIYIQNSNPYPTQTIYSTAYRSNIGSEYPGLHREAGGANQESDPGVAFGGVIPPCTTVSFPPELQTGSPSALVPLLVTEDAEGTWWAEYNGFQRPKESELSPPPDWSSEPARPVISQNFDPVAMKFELSRDEAEMYFTPEEIVFPVSDKLNDQGIVKYKYFHVFLGPEWDVGHLVEHQPSLTCAS